MKVTGSHLITQALRAEGIDTAFAIAGDHTLHLMDVMAEEGFRFVDTRHEQGAVDMANAYGRITGKPGLSMFTTPGHANAIPGLTLAHHMESPLVNISGSAELSRLGQGAAQEIDQVGMAKPVTKGSWMVSDPRRIPEALARAFRTALTGRRGPVHLTIPVDVQRAEVDDAEVKVYQPEEYRPMESTAGSPAAVQQAIELLQTAERPIVVLGNGGYSVDRQDLELLAEITSIPVLTEMAGRGVISDDHPNCFGVADWRYANPAKLLATADVVMLLGKRMDFTFSFGEPPTFRPDVRIIQVESETDLIGRPRGVDVAIHGAVGPVVRQLAEEAEGKRWSESPIAAELAEAGVKQRKVLDQQAKAESPVHSMDVHSVIKDLIDDDTLLIFEGSDFAFYGAAYHPAVHPNRWFVNGTLGMIGWGVPFGIGAKLAAPNSKVVVFTGDGAFGFNAMEIDTAVRHQIPVVVIVGNDTVWGIDYHQQVAFYDRPVATQLLPTRYDKLAEALGAHGEYVESADQLDGALRRALSSEGPAVVNVRTMPSPSPLTDWIVETKLHQGEGR